MAECVYCEIQKFKEAIIYSDDDIAIAVNPFAIAQNELVIIPKNHFTIMEQVPKEIISKMGLFSKYLSILLFQKLECHGTNVLAENGTSAGQLIPHFSISIIPRYENDDIDLSWSPSRVQESSIKAAAELLTGGIKKALSESTSMNNPIPAQNTTADSASSGIEGAAANPDNGYDENAYYSKKFRRVP